MNTKPMLALTPFLLMGLVGCSSRPAKPQRGETDRLPHVETLNPSYQPLKETVDLLATVEALERARLSAQVQGEVKDLRPSIDIGKKITAGEELIKLDIPALDAELVSKEALQGQAENQFQLAQEAEKVAEHDIKEAEAQQKRYQADLDFRDLALKRTRELVAKGTLQPQLLEEAQLQRNSSLAALEAATVGVSTKKAKLEAARADLKVAQSRINVAKADVKLTRAKVGFATIKAPFTGMITRRWVDNGVIIRDSSMPLLTVIRTDQVRIVVFVPERYVNFIRAPQGNPAGKPSKVTINIHNFHQEARITRLASAVNDVTRLMRAEVHVQNDKDLLRPGMTGTVTLQLNDATHERLTVPSTALVRVGDEIRVYCLDVFPDSNPTQGRVRATRVTIGQDDGKIVEIKTGLTRHDLVIAKGNGVVRAGETAIAVPARERSQE